MRLHEYEALDIFEQNRIPVPRRGVANTMHEALDIAGEIGYPVILKAQVLVGGRGLAGGIKTASSPDELKDIADSLLSSEIKGLSVRKILVCEKLEIEKELYLGITIDGYSGKPVIVVSTEGGVLIEETARTSPEKIAAIHIDPSFGYYPYQARGLLKMLGLKQQLVTAWSEIIGRLFNIVLRYESLIAEINPLAVLPNGGLFAVDAVLEVDNSALSRIRMPLPDRIDRIENPLERRGREIGVTYVDLDGDIGIISSGAGLGMASMDIIGKHMKPANFLETGGGITADQLYRCMELVMMKPNLRAIFINIYGGINPIHEGAKGVVRYIKEHKLKIPVVAKALGNRQEETWEIFRSAGVHVVVEAATEKAVDKLYELVKQ
ncbi:MAG: Succinyl-CoA ligase (ADP-forming) subunit beta [Deltaproteobacteria bacterium ADurb.Bin026]|jgi:succinyl-CoA synthetase beta subunit|nr:acetate--CoA ligase family protein [Syntrophorhabdaceae bacterium]MDI9559806.1 acetate--CoA ligase family protein [Pseudomonadota bacterium]OQC49851.1 MAG: Succinyl-CoA ligase (ADP-forming) subunit beta [Deltaproteobacteria bacterium ADurb.Bin026]HOS59970.1 acetate--CoA ligase family protein [Syntrophorhabdaceae bacterium]HQG51356.1 acetate--CoA ligase family protein [Syntrophorhabdaceae bacterium]